MILRVTMHKGLLFLLFLSSSVCAQWQAEDPYGTGLKHSEATHELKLRIVDYGLHKPERLLKMIKVSEIVLSQCPQINLKITVDEVIKKIPTTIHEDMFVMMDLPYRLKQNYFNFFDSFRKSHKEGRIDIHLLDYLSTRDREREPGTPVFNYGKAYISYLQDWLFRAIDYKPDTVTPSALSRNSVLLGMKAVRDDIKDRRERTRRGRSPLVTIRTHDTLLAHELGHILLETQKPGLDDIYIDHYCPDTGDACEPEYLMSAGGAKDAIQYQRQSDGTLVPSLYHKIPLVEPSQCEALVSHPSVLKIKNSN